MLLYTFIIINQSQVMHNKNHSQSNAETSDGDDEDSINFLNSSTSSISPICDVWMHNFETQLAYLSSLAVSYPVLALDTQFPGNLVKRNHLSSVYEQEELDYQIIWHNVEKTKLIQIGISVSDANGNTPPNVSSWQFNLSFDLNNENNVPSSVELLQEAGIAFERLPSQGIPHQKFAQAIISSGLILNKSLKWVVFHGCYDLAYILRLLRGQSLPKTSQDFYKSLKIYFPSIYDLKEITKDEELFRRDGLSAIAAKIGCIYEGPIHQAGSDSLLTLKCYFQLRKLFGDRQFQEKINLVCGITSPPAKVSSQAIQSYSLSSNYAPQYYPSVQNNYPSGPLYQYLHYNSSYTNIFAQPHSYNYGGFSESWRGFYAKKGQK